MALLDAKELVVVLVGFHPNVLAGFQSHKDQLQMVAGVDLPEGGILFSQFSISAM